MLHLICNPASGKGRPERYLRKYARKLDRLGVPYAVHKTEYAGHMKTLVAEIEANGDTDLVVFGGDGTFHEALNAVSDPTRMRLGLVPCGSGNDFASSGKFCKRRPMRALKAVLAGTTRKLDYLQFDNGVRCLNIAGTGLDIEVLKVARAIRRLKGKPNYLLALLRVLKRFEPYRLAIEADGESAEYECIVAGVCNGRAFGGGMRLSPRSELDDGLLDLVVVKMVERKKLKYLLPKFLGGKHIDLPVTVAKRVKRVVINGGAPLAAELDGEFYTLPFACTVVAKGLTVFYG